MGRFLLATLLFLFEVGKQLLDLVLKCFAQLLFHDLEVKIFQSCGQVVRLLLGDASDITGEGNARFVHDFAYRFLKGLIMGKKTLFFGQRATKKF